MAILRVGELIAEREAALGITLTHDAIKEGTGLSRNTVILYRKDRVDRPSITTLKAFMRYFGVTRLSEMFSSEEIKP